MRDIMCIHKWSTPRKNDGEYDGEYSGTRYCLKCLAEETNSSEFHKTLHKFRVMIYSLPIKNTNYRWRICDRNRNIGWNECRLEMLKKIGDIYETPTSNRE